CWRRWRPTTRAWRCWSGSWPWPARRWWSRSCWPGVHAGCAGWLRGSARKPPPCSVAPEQQLPVAHVDPAVVLKPYLVEARDIAETQALMQCNAGCIGQGDATDGGMQPEVAQLVQQRGVEGVADAAPGAVAREVDRGFDRVAVGLPGLPRRCVGIADDGFVLLRHQPWQAGAKHRVDPPGHVGGLDRCGLEADAGVGHVRVVDRGDRAGVGRGGCADMHRGAGQVWIRRPPPKDQLSQVVSLKT